MKADISSGSIRLSETQRSYSPDEILAAGGATAFGRKSGKNNQTLIHALENAAPIEPFTEEEWNDLLAQLERDK
ncbi:hypothetical protein [Dyadobacter sp. NIV53]|uniref:hypothetical protein n=1 Tax=Dyadobacter sp. NIV53 TaxID=2861765 RepID=UPI001C88024F|nr:hypothetical protein [Dyadobacter sp. NIV53]